MKLTSTTSEKNRSKLMGLSVSDEMDATRTLTVSGINKALSTNMTAENMNMIQKFQRHPARDSET
jgi:hypothetical protein